MKRVLFHGCWDILHYGHMMALEQAAGFGDKLIVSLSADEYIRKIKPPPRPVQNEAMRAYQLRCLRFVHEVFICYDDTGAQAIRSVRPDIFVRGCDYKDRGIVLMEAQACRDVGCEVRYTDTPKYSSGDYVPHLQFQQGQVIRVDLDSIAP